MPKLHEERQLGSFRFRSDTNELIEPDGRTIALRPQTAHVLEALLEKSDQVVGKDELIEQVWADTHVTDDSLVQCISEIRKALGTEEAKRLKTIPKRGYRIVTAARLGKEIETSVLTKSRRMARVAIVLLGIAGLGLFAAYFLLPPEHAIIERPSEKGKRVVVVLPVKPVGKDASLGILADGLTDDITMALARHRNLLVISRDSAFLYRGSSENLEYIANKLNVELVVAGTLRSVGNELKLTLRLSEAKSGALVWAESFEADTANSLVLHQTAIASLNTAFAKDSGPAPYVSQTVIQTKSQEAYRAFTAGRQHFYLYRNKAENLTARAYFETALSHDAGFALARAMLAWTFAFEAMNGWADDREAALDRAFEDAEIAKRINPEIPIVYFVRGLVFRERGEYVKALVEAEKATEIEPSYANGQVLLATLFYYAGRPEQSIERLRVAMKINPHHPFNYTFHLGQAYFTLEDYEKAIEAFENGLESNPSAERLHVWLAAAYALAGKLDDAKWEADQVLTINPGFTISKISEAFPYKDQKDRNRFLDGLRRAGLS